MSRARSRGTSRLQRRCGRPTTRRSAQRERQVDALLRQPLRRTPRSRSRSATTPACGRLCRAGLAEADLVQAGRLRNPGIRVQEARTRTSRRSIEQCWHQCRGAGPDAAGAENIEQGTIRAGQARGRGPTSSPLPWRDPARVSMPWRRGRWPYTQPGRRVGGSVERAGAPDAAGRELEPTGEIARAGVLRRGGGTARARRAGGDRRTRAADPPAGALGADLGFMLPARLARPAGSAARARRCASGRRWSSGSTRAAARSWMPRAARRWG